MIENLKNIFKNTRRQFVGCIDTCFIEGTVLKHIEKSSWKIKIKDDFNERLKNFLNINCILLINEINEFEIKNKLLKDYSISMIQAKSIFDRSIDMLKVVKKIQIKEIRITSDLIHWMLKNRLSFQDGLLISIAQKLQVPFITSEKRAENWKSAYEGVIGEKEFWNIILKKN